MDVFSKKFHLKIDLGHPWTSLVMLIAWVQEGEAAKLSDDSDASPIKKAAKKWVPNALLVGFFVDFQGFTLLNHTDGSVENECISKMIVSLNILLVSLH